MEFPGISAPPDTTIWNCGQLRKQYPEFRRLTSFHEMAGFRMKKWIIGTRMPCDRHAVRELFARLVAFACAAISVHEIEINPLIVGDERAGAAAVDALVAMVQQ